MDKNRSFGSHMTMDPSKMVFTNQLATFESFQDESRQSLGDIRNMVCGSGEDSNLKVLLRNAVNQELLQLAGPSYVAKGHAKRQRSGSKKAPKKPAGGKKSKSAGSRKRNPSKKAGGKAAPKGKKSPAGGKKASSKKRKSPKKQAKSKAEETMFL